MGKSEKAFFVLLLCSEGMKMPPASNSMNTRGQVV